MFLPRFSITGTYDLKKTLSHLGITRVFQEYGDLARIVPNRSLKVGEVSLPAWAPPGRPHPSAQQARTPPSQAELPQPAPPATCSGGIGPSQPHASGCAIRTHSRAGMEVDSEQEYVAKAQSTDEASERVSAEPDPGSRASPAVGEAVSMVCVSKS